MDDEKQADLTDDCGMTYTRESFEKVLGILTDQCIIGSLHMRMAARISSTLEDRAAVESFYFPLVVALDAFHNSSLLHLIRLFDRSSASLTLHKLLRVAKANTKLFTKLSPDAACEIIAADERRLDDELVPLLETLKARRDSYIAHLDQKHLMTKSVYELGELYPLSRDEIATLWRAALDMVAQYYRFLHDCDFHLDEVTGEEDMDSLLEALKEQEKEQYRPK